MFETHTPRILVIPPMYGGSLPVARYCEDALRRLGASVEVFESPDYHPAYAAMDNLRVGAERLDHLQNAFLQVVNQMILAKVEAYEPDLVFALAQAPLSRGTLRRLRKDGVATAMWFVEDFRLFTYWKAFAPLYDVFAVIQKEPFAARLEEVGQPNHLYLPMAADPEFHRPLELSSVERRQWGEAVSFMGAGYPNRRVGFRKLLNHDLKIWGSDWDGDPVLAPYLQLAGRRVSSEECVKIFNATQINLNLHSSVNPEQFVSGGDFINPRTFELASCGAFQLVDRRALLGEAFVLEGPQAELATFGSADELQEHIRYYLAHPEERTAMAERARIRVLAEHTYEARMAELLGFCEERLSTYPRKREGQTLSLADFPPELADELEALFARTGLAPSASFADVVAAIRSESGQLGSLETSILFLDEWRKQYGMK